MVIDFSPFYGFNSQIDKLLEDIWTPAAHGRRTPYPLINVSEDDAAVYVHCEAPGVPIEAMEITLMESSLTIRGERRPEQGKYYRQERPSGVFQRIVTINAPVDRDNIKASLKHGLLTITLPKRRTSSPRTITVD